MRSRFKHFVLLTSSYLSCLSLLECPFRRVIVTPALEPTRIVPDLKLQVGIKLFTRMALSSYHI